ncbi:MAG: glycoside hydrolase family 16 protein [Nocardioides sp.]
MSHLRAFVAFALTVALLPLLLTAPGNAAMVSDGASLSKTTKTSAARKKAQRGRIAVLPTVSSSSKRDQSANRAKAVGEAIFPSVKAGRKVVVQRSNDGGSTWSKWDVQKTDDNGRVAFKPASPAGAGYWTYQAKVKGLPAKTGTATDDWNLIFDESFSSRSSFDSRWSTRGDAYDKGSLRKCSKASPKMAKVGGGVLTLKVKRDGSRKGDVCKWRKPGTSKKFKNPYYLNGHVGTEQSFDFRYGVAAARVKFQKSRGMHGSFWMNTSGNAPQGTRPVEIDAVEFFGKGHKDGGLAQFLHYKGRKIGGLKKNAGDVLKGSDNWWKKYHVFSVEWTPQGYSFRIDGQETFRTSKAVSNKQVFPILSLLSSDYELKNMPKSGKGSLKVDWVRVWQTPELARKNLQ